MAYSYSTMNTPQPSALLKHMWQEPPEVLYHYTRVDVLEKLTRTANDMGKLWATDVRYLNDRSEQIEARRFIEELLMRRTSRDKAAQRKIRSDLQTYVDEKDDTFVASFSSNGDSLPQWRGYCAAGAGVSIGFRSSSLRSPDLEFEETEDNGNPDDDTALDFRLLKCAYTAAEKESIVTEEIDRYISMVRGEHPHIKPARSATFIQNTLVMCRPIFKDESFKEEEEWRAVLSCYYPQIPKREFRPGVSMLIPYITLGIAKNDPAHYISHIVIGPTPHEALAKLAVQKLLRSRGLEGVKVENSKNPFRSW